MAKHLLAFFGFCLRILGFICNLGFFIRFSDNAIASFVILVYVNVLCICLKMLSISVDAVLSIVVMFYAVGFINLNGLLIIDLFGFFRLMTNILCICRRSFIFNLIGELVKTILVCSFRNLRNFGIPSTNTLFVSP